MKSKTTGLNVFLNNEFYKETSFFSGGALLTNVKTGRYILKIEKNDHKPWYKSVDVFPEQVTELRNILILPEKIDIAVLEAAGDNIVSISPDGSRILFAKKEKSLLTLFLFSIEDKKSYPITQVSQSQISRVIWENSTVILQRGDFFSVVKESLKNLVEEPIVPPSKFGFINVDFYPSTKDSLLVLDSDGKLYLLGTGVAKKIRDNVNSFGVYGSDIFFVDKNGFLAKLNIDTNEVKIIDRPGFFLSDEPAEVKFSSKGDLFLIDSSGGLFFVSRQEEDIIHPVAGEVRGAEFDSEGKKLLFWTPNEIKIFWVEPNIYQPFQKEFAIEPIFKIDSGLQEAGWFTKDDFHIIIRADSGVYITEIDGRGGRNTIELTNEKTDKIFWDKNLNKLYFSSPEGIKTINL